MAAAKGAWAEAAPAAAPAKGAGSGRAALAKERVDVVALDGERAKDEVADKLAGRVLDDILRRGELGDAAVLQDEGAIAHGERFLRVVRDHDGGEVVLLRHLHDLVLDGLLDDAVQRGEGLVQQQDARLDHQGARQGDALLLSAGELRDALVEVLFQTKQRDHLGHLLVHGDAGVVAKAIGDVVIGVEVGE